MYSVCTSTPAFATACVKLVKVALSSFSTSVSTADGALVPIPTLPPVGVPVEVATSDTCKVFAGFVSRRFPARSASARSVELPVPAVTTVPSAAVV